MKIVGNIIWFILIGIWSWIGWVLIGLIFCITIIGIPPWNAMFQNCEVISTTIWKRC